MSLSFVRMDPGLPIHRKMLRLARRLDISRVHAIGIYTMLMCHTAQNYEDGELAGCDELDVADMVDWAGSAELLVAALVKESVLETSDTGYTFHGWRERYAPVFAERERSRKRREKRDGPTTVAPPTDPGATTDAAGGRATESETTAGRPRSGRGRNGNDRGATVVAGHRVEESIGEKRRESRSGGGTASPLSLSRPSIPDPGKPDPKGPPRAIPKAWWDELLGTYPRVERPGSAKGELLAVMTGVPSETWPALRDEILAGAQVLRRHAAGLPHEDARFLLGLRNWIKEQGWKGTDPTDGEETWRENLRRVKERV